MMTEESFRQGKTQARLYAPFFAECDFFLILRERFKV